MEGSATFTMLESSTIMRSPRHSTYSASQRLLASVIVGLLGRRLVTLSTNAGPRIRQTGPRNRTHRPEEADPRAGGRGRGARGSHVAARLHDPEPGGDVRPVGVGGV